MIDNCYEFSGLAYVNVQHHQFYFSPGLAIKWRQQSLLALSFWISSCLQFTIFFHCFRSVSGSMFDNDLTYTSVTTFYIQINLDILVKALSARVEVDLCKMFSALYLEDLNQCLHFIWVLTSFVCLHFQFIAWYMLDFS